MEQMDIASAQFMIRLRHERSYTLGSADNVHRYDREERLAEGLFTSFHGVECDSGGGPKRSCLIAASGGATTIHEHSAVIFEDSLVLAAGDSLCRLSLPNLELLWHRKVDDATCFGVHWCPSQQCLVSHGELEIVRLSLDGDIAWRSGGRDIFSEGIEVFDDHVMAEDFYHGRYRIDIVTGKSVLLT